MKVGKYADTRHEVGDLVKKKSSGKICTIVESDGRYVRVLMGGVLWPESYKGPVWIGSFEVLE